MTAGNVSVHQRIVCTYTLCVLLGCILAFDAIAAATNARMPAETILDIGTLLRFLAGVLLAFIAYWTRGIEKRVENGEHELKQQATQISLLREQIIRDYHTKHEIEKMGVSVNNGIERLNRRLDMLVRPTHVRRQDEEHGDGWLDRGQG